MQQAAGTALWPAIAGPANRIPRDAFGQLLNDPIRRGQHVDALVNELCTPLLVPGNPVYAGFEIDYEGIDNRYQVGFLQFLRDLTDQAHGLGKQISITVGAC